MFKHRLLATLAITLFILAAQFPLPATAQARDLPDFTQLVEQQGPTVVNISTTQVRPQRNAGTTPRGQQAPQLDENDPFYEFFRRFLPREPGQGQSPSPREPESRSLGSGFIVSADGYILTNAHVVENAEEINVKLTDKREFRARVIGTDKRTDVALIKIEASALPTVRLGDPTKLRVGEWVLAIGSPFGFDNTVTAGIVSAKGRSLPSENIVPFIQTDVAINPGNSGGPLFNMRGEVIGINSQIYSRTGGFMGLSFAIPIDVAMDVQQQLRQYGRVSRGRIGVVIQEVSRELAESFGLPKAAGALVNGVEKAGPAEKAGIESGDIILRFDGKEVASSSDLPRIVGNTKPGSKSSIEVWRKGARREFAIVVAEVPEDRLTSRPTQTPSPARTELAAIGRLGLMVSDLGAEQKRERNLAGGVVVQEVRSKLELRQGDVIVALTSKGQSSEITTATQFNEVLSKLDRAASITLHVRRGEANVFVTVRPETPRG
jgi:serine protease Do